MKCTQGNHRLIVILISLWAVCGVLAFQFIDIPLLHWVRSCVSEGSLFFNICFYMSRMGGFSFLAIVGLLLYFVPNYFWPWVLRWRNRCEPIYLTRRYHLVMLHFALVAGLGSIFTNILKYAIGRARPFMYLEQGVYGFLGPVGIRNSDSLPSGHTVAIWGAALVLSHTFPRYKYLCFFVAVLVSVTRVLLSRHWLSDIFAGVAFAVLLNWIFTRVVYSEGKGVFYGDLPSATRPS